MPTVHHAPDRPTPTAAPLAPPSEPFQWTALDLSRSLYYPASYCDLRALFRFSHLVRRFVFADYGDIDAARVRQLLQREDGLRVVAEVAHPAVLAPSPALLDREHTRWASGHAWTRGFVLERSVGREVRRLELLFVGGEAFRVYDELYRKRGVAPLILYTVNSGADEGGGWVALEEEGGVFDRFVLDAPERSFLRVRGRHNRRYYGAPPYGHLVQGSMGAVPFEAVFAAEPLGLTDHAEITGTRRVVLRRVPLTRGEARAHCAVFVSGGDMARRLLRGGSSAGIHVLPEGTTWSALLREVDAACERSGARSALVTPVPWADEGQLLREWVERPGLPETLEVRFVDELDLADLRGVERTTWWKGGP